MLYLFCYACFRACYIDCVIYISKLFSFMLYIFHYACFRAIMQWRCLMLGLSLLVGSLTPATSFVLHKRHAPSKDDNSENRLSQALNVIARERRRLRDDDTWRSPQEPYPSDQGEYDRYDDRAVQQLLASLLEGGLPQVRGWIPDNIYRIKPEELYILSCGNRRGRRPWPFPQLRM